MNFRRLALLVGILALGLGVVVSVAPWFVPFNLDRMLISVIGILALIQAFRVIQTRRHDDLDEAETPDPELPVPTQSPGDELETVLEQFLGRQRLYYHRKRIREGLQAAAIAVLTQYGGYSELEAQEQLETGTWTDNVYAAAFLGGEAAPVPSFRARIWDTVRRKSALQQNVRHTVDAIAATAGLTPRSNGETASSGRQKTRHAGANDASPTRFTTRKDHEFDENTVEVVSREPHSTGHWQGVSVVALIGIGAGILAEQPGVLLVGVVGIGFAAYARSSALPPGSVSIDRTLSKEQPEPGNEIEVTVTVTNENDRLLPDLRLIDGVPEALAVANGSPRFGTALRPGESTTFTYTITARRGVHSFGPTIVVARDLTTTIEQELVHKVETTVTCVPSLRTSTEPVPLREQATQYVGQVETTTGGEGIEFYATRDYQPGDAMSRIDWNHRARTGEFTTVEYRKERTATIVIVIDAREDAYVSPEPHTQHAVDYAVNAAGQLFTTLSESGNYVGIAAVGSDSCWLAPNASPDHRVKARELLATHPALAPVPETNRSPSVRWRKQFRRRLSPGTQLILLTPLCDEYGGRLARRFDESGFPVTVVSPDPTADRTASHRLARVARTLQLTSLRSTGIPVIDWPWNETIDVALARYNERLSR